MLNTTLILNQPNPFEDAKMIRYADGRTFGCVTFSSHQAVSPLTLIRAHGLWVVGLGSGLKLVGLD